MTPLRIIFCGSRDWEDQSYILTVMQALKDNLGEFVVIEGEARGADKMARWVAENMCYLPVVGYPANWELFGKAAGPIRNEQMLRDGKADAVVAFHDDLASSKGTKHMVEFARMMGKPVWVSTEPPIALAEFIIKLRAVQKGKDGK